MTDSALLDLARLTRMIAEHVVVLEARSPSWDTLPADVVMRLVRLEERLARQAREPNPLAELGRRVEALEARHNLAGCNAQRKARGDALRQAIADILETEPAATAPRVLECLGRTHTGTLPSDRAIRWHLRALRGNGNTGVLPPTA